MLDLSDTAISNEWHPHVHICWQGSQTCKFTPMILFIDWPMFSQNAQLGKCSIHIKANNNRHVWSCYRRQYRFTVNMCMGIIGNTFIGPYFQSECITGVSYAHFGRCVVHVVSGRYRRDTPQHVILAWVVLSCIYRYMCLFLDLT